MSTFTQDFLIHFIKNGNKLLGESIKAYIECERGKREILQSNDENYIAADGELCKAYSYAQNNILLEIKYQFMLKSLIKDILDGKLIKKQTNNRRKTSRVKVVKVEGGKRKKKQKQLGKETNSKIETIGIGGFHKIKLMISMFLLISLKSFAESSEDSNIAVAHKYTPSNYHFLYKTIPQTKPLDTLNEEQMHAETLRFVDDMPPVNNSPMYSTNFTKQFFDISKSLHRYQLYEFTTADFHAEVMDLVQDLFNNALYPTHELMTQVCDAFIGSLDDTNPEEMSEYLAALTEKNKDEHDGHLLDLKRSLDDGVKTYVDETTPQVQNTQSWYDYLSDSIKPQPSDVKYAPMDGQEHNGTRDEKIIHHSKGIPDVISNYEQEYQKYLENEVINTARKGSSLARRRKYLSGICAFSLNTCVLKYNATDGTLFFTDFPYRRSHIDVIIDNVLRVTDRNHYTGRVTDNVKQIEMAKFLQLILNKWDGALKKFMTTGHNGKKTMDGFINGFKKEILALRKFASFGLNGNPTELKEAHERYTVSVANQVISDMEYEQDLQNFRNQNRTQTLQANSWNSWFDSKTNIISTQFDGIAGWWSKFTYSTFYLLLFICVAGSVATLFCFATITYAFGLVPTILIGNLKNALFKKTNNGIEAKPTHVVNITRKNTRKEKEDAQKLKALKEKTKLAKRQMDDTIN